MDNSQQDRENYLHIAIRRSSKGDDFIAKFRSPIGEMESEFTLSVSQMDITQAMDRTAQTAIKSFTRSGADNALDPMKGIGQRLFTALFKGRPEVLYRQSQEKARGGLLVLLHMENDPELQAMPWEFLHDGQDYINLSTRSTLVRGPLGTSDSPPPEPITPPLRILFVTASSKGILPVSELVSGIEDLPGFDIQEISDPTGETFTEALYEFKPHILHLAVHGEFDSPISRTSNRFLFESNMGLRYLTEFGKMRKEAGFSFKESLRLICLYTDGAYLIASRLAESGPAMIEIRSDLTTDRALITFTHSLYQAISAGQTLATAISRGRQAMALQNPGSLEWGLPVLYTSTPEAVLLARAQPKSMSMSLPASAESPATVPGQQRELSKLQIKLGILQRNLETIEKQKTVSFGLLSPGLDEETREMQKEIAAIKTRVHEIALRSQD